VIHLLLGLLQLLLRLLRVLGHDLPVPCVLVESPLRNMAVGHRKSYLKTSRTSLVAFGKPLHMAAQHSISQNEEIRSLARSVFVPN
jgi:hypothetical protein